MEAPVCQDGMNDDGEFSLTSAYSWTLSQIPSLEPLSDEDFQQAIDPRDHRRSFIPEAISPAARLRVHHENTSSAYYTHPFSLP